MNNGLRLKAVITLGAVVFSLWVVEIPKSWAKCWTVNGATFCDNRENLDKKPDDVVSPEPPTPGEIEAREARERRAKANDFNEAGIAAWNRGEWGIAAEQFREAYAWNPNSKVIFNNLINAKHKVGLVAMEEGDWEHAAVMFQSLLYHVPNSQEFKRHAAVVEEKRQAVRQAYELNNQGRKAADNGDWTAALAYFQRAAQNDLGNAVYANNIKIAQANELNERGRTAARNGNWASALEHFQHAARIDPNEPAYTGNIVLARSKVEDQQNQEVVAKVQKSVNAIREDVKNAQPVGDLELSDLDETQDAFGSKKSNPKLAPAEAQAKEGRGTDPGKQLKSVARHSREAQMTRNDTVKIKSGIGIDVPGKESGDLVYPDKNKPQRLLDSALDKQIPKGAKDDRQIKEMQEWYRALDARKAEKERMIAEIREKQRTSNDPLLDTKIATLANDVKRLAGDQDKATEVVKERVKVIKKQKLDMGLAWDEELSTDNPSALK
ncbi:MAG: tetratricopeptide repeat protein [Burkholderiales bacterium]